MRMYALALMACLAGLSGCGQKVVYRPAAANESYTINAPQAVFDHQATANRAAVDTSAKPWYATRNNDHLSYRPGASEARASGHVIDIYDRQTTSHDRVRDYYRRRTRSIQVGIDIR